MDRLSWNGSPLHVGIKTLHKYRFKVLRHRCRLCSRLCSDGYVGCDRCLSLAVESDGTCRQCYPRIALIVAASLLNKLHDLAIAYDLTAIEAVSINARQRGRGKERLFPVK